MPFLIIILNLRHYGYVTNYIDDALVPSFGTVETFTVDTSKSNFSKKKRSHGKIQNCLRGLSRTGNCAAGAGYYLCKKFLSKDGEEDSSSSIQVKLGN